VLLFYLIFQRRGAKTQRTQSFYLFFSVIFASSRFCVKRIIIRVLKIKSKSVIVLFNFSTQRREGAEDAKFFIGLFSAIFAPWRLCVKRTIIRVLKIKSKSVIVLFNFSTQRRKDAEDAKFFIGFSLRSLRLRVFALREL